MNDRSNEQTEERTCATCRWPVWFNGYAWEHQDNHCPKPWHAACPATILTPAPSEEPRCSCIYKTDCSYGDPFRCDNTTCPIHDRPKPPAKPKRPAIKEGGYMSVDPVEAVEYNRATIEAIRDLAEPKDAVKDEPNRFCPVLTDRSFLSYCGKPVVAGARYCVEHHAAYDAMTPPVKDEPCISVSCPRCELTWSEPIDATPPVKDEWFDAWAEARAIADKYAPGELGLVNHLARRFEEWNARRSTAPLDVRKAAERIAEEVLTHEDSDRKTCDSSYCATCKHYFLNCYKRADGHTFMPQPCNCSVASDKEKIAAIIADELSALMEGK